MREAGFTRRRAMQRTRSSAIAIIAAACALALYIVIDARTVSEAPSQLTEHRRNNQGSGSLDDGSSFGDEPPKRVDRQAPTIGLTGQWRGLLLCADGTPYTKCCPYAIVQGDAVPSTSSQPTSITGEDGSWSVSGGLHGALVSVVFWIAPHCQIAFKLRREAFDDGPPLLWLPPMGECEIVLGSPLRVTDLAWDCNMEPWDHRFPERSETISKLVMHDIVVTGERIVTLCSMKFMGLKAGDKVRYEAPLGCHVVISPWSAGYDLRVATPRAVVPSAHEIVGEVRRGLWVKLIGDAGDAAEEDGMAFVRRGDRVSWMRFPMYKGEGFVTRERLGPSGVVKVEYCSAAGEFFERIVDVGEESEDLRVDFIKGQGRAGLSFASGDRRLVSAWYRSGDEGWSRLSVAGSSAFEARQVRVQEGVVLLSLPAERQAILFWDDGSAAVVSADGEVRWLKGDEGGPRFQVVPRHLVQQLAGNECLMVTMQAAIDGDENRWIDMDSRRATPGDPLAGWTVCAPKGLRYRMAWRRLMEVEGKWVEADRGLHDIAGPYGVRAPQDRR